MTKHFLSSLFLLLAVSFVSAQETLPLPSGTPPEVPGKCYAVCYIPAEFNSVTENISTYGAGEHMLVIEPTYETFSEQVMIKPASYRLVDVAAEYTTTEDRILITPAYEEMVVEPAKFETVTERVLVEESSSSYRVGQPGFTTVTNAKLYYGSPEGTEPGIVSTDYGNILDPSGRKGVDGVTDPFNPGNPNSFINDPNSPLNVSPSLYANSDMAKLLDPNNADSPFSATYIKANGIEAAQREGNRLLQRMQVGTIAPYITQEARVKLDRIPRTTVTESVEVEVSPAYMTYQQMPVKCETGDCVSFCQVEVPAQMETINKTIPQPCPAGYTVAAMEQGGADYCVRLSYEPAVYGARQVLVGGAAITERQSDAKYRDVKVKRLVSPAKVVTRQVEATYETITKRVVSREAFTRYELVPAEYKTITRRVRTGLAGAEFIVPGGVLMAPTTYSAGTDNAPGTIGSLPTLVNPGAGGKLPGSVLPYTLGAGPDRAGNIEANGYAPINSTPGNGIEGMPANYYTAGCPTGYRYDALDGLCKTTEATSGGSASYTKAVLTGKGNFSDWVEVVCPGKGSTASIRDVQRALNKLGYPAGTADGIMGARTKTALAKYQRDNGLPIGGMNAPTLKKLGLR
ncbi:peptidoglycan-binding domain-containing protein [Neolewinella persica]|uniref:peptidoglycan-binding domain-containing protein n=1 Tax=Neolewinella persica TaxID=70998 RepID=UPI000377FEDA|nr:peptidoglycan-binding domain-containing protein [Neolewinella persica]